MADDVTSERIDAPTPNGGAYSVANFRDKDGAPCPKVDAVGVEILEFDAEDQCVGRTYLDRGAGGDSWMGEDEGNP
jgi:hypothetical protein